MACISFTPHLERFITCPATEVAAGTVREVLDSVFAQNPALRGYIVDDQDACVSTLPPSSTTGSLWASENQGDSWSTVSSNLPPVYCVRFVD